MFDSLREQANESSFNQDKDDFGPESADRTVLAASSSDQPFLGMTPRQRFVIAAMLLIAVCALGTMVLLVAGRIGFL